MSKTVIRPKVGRISLKELMRGEHTPAERQKPYRPRSGAGFRGGTASGNTEHRAAK